MIVGRDSEREAIERFLEATSAGPSSLMLEGEPGIGKTTLWTFALAHAEEAGFALARTRPVESEASVSFACLGDLVEDLTGYASIPVADEHRDALNAALGRSGSANDPKPRSLGVAFRTLLEEACRERPLIVAIDDVQWADVASLRVVTFAFRRLRHGRVGLLIAARAGSPAGNELAESVRDAMVRIPVPPMDVDALAHVVAERLGISIDPAAGRRIHRASGGNPFYALEIAAALDRDEPGVTGMTIPIPRTMREDVMRTRMSGLSEDARRLLLAAASSNKPTPQLLETVVGTGLDRALDACVSAQVVDVTRGLVRFTHPIFRSVTYADASRGRRRQMHRTLADLVDDREERVRHLALSTTGTDGAIASDLEDAAASARTRGALEACSDLLRLAAMLTPPQEERALGRRLRLGAEVRFSLGDTEAGLALASRAVEVAPAGPDRAEALLGQGRIQRFGSRDDDAIETLGSALQEPGRTPETELRTHVELFQVLHRRGSGDRAAEHELAARSGASSSQQQVLVSIAAEAMGIDPASVPGLGSEAERGAGSTGAETQRPSDRPMQEWPDVVGADILVGRDDLQVALARTVELLAIAEERGEDAARATLLGVLSEAERRLGDLAGAEAHARDALDLSFHLSHGVARTLVLLGAVQAERGDEETAAETFAHARAGSGLRDVEIELGTAVHLGRALLSSGDPRAARRILDPAVTTMAEARIAEPSRYPLAPGAVEARSETDDIAGAEEVTVWLERRAAALGRPSVTASAEHCRGVVSLASGGVDDAIEHLERALARWRTLPMPLERAWTLLWLGVANRRARRHRVARGSLSQAIATFGEIGASAWSARATAELARIPGRRPNEAVLTEAEQAVAKLAAAGLRNREIAIQLFISVRTVESHLSHAFVKLDVRSRTELALFFDGSATD